MDPILFSHASCSFLRNAFSIPQSNCNSSNVPQLRKKLKLCIKRRESFLSFQETFFIEDSCQTVMFVASHVSFAVIPVVLHVV